MKKLLVIFGLLTFSTFSYAQMDQLLGKWVFEKISAEADIDEERRAMGNKFFKDMSVSLTETNYTLAMMGGEENGTWSLVEGDTYEFTSTRSTQSEIKIVKLSENQILFSMGNKGVLQLIKSDEEANVVVEEKRIDKVESLIVDRAALSGQWFNNGHVVADDADEFNKKLGGIRFKHKDEEYGSFTFNIDGSFVEKAWGGEVVNSTWGVEEDNKTLTLKVGEYNKYFKVVKLNDTELYLYNPLTDKVMKYLR